MLAPFLAACAHTPAVETDEATPSPGIHLTSRMISYAVRGSTIVELRQAMARIGPIDDGAHRFAHTWGTYAWRFSHNETGSTCHVAPKSVELEIVQTFPTWVSPRAATEPTVREWERWASATRAHEEHHRAILTSTAEKLAAGSLEASRASCNEAEQAANATGNRLLDEMRAAHAAYDRETQHGERTGCLLRDVP
jgi:predicted secreted Zn-dependent protease